MSKIVYLLGAGASRGSRNNKKLGPFAYYESGVPIVSEFANALDSYCSSFYPRPRFWGQDAYESIKYKWLYEELTWLRDISKDNLTIDNYAKVLWSTGRLDELRRLKRAMAVFFSLIQKPEKRDKRYDNFLEKLSVFGGKIQADLSIFSWNYDRQVEYALHRYDLADMSDTHQLQICHISSKNHTTRYIAPGEFNLIKLNGTATFLYPSDLYLLEQKDTTPETFEYQLARGFPSIDTSLSFAWEEDDHFIDAILPLTSDTEILIIIGYSMPDVNYKVDSRLITNMRNLRSIIIQDCNATALKNKLFELLSDSQSELVKNNLISVRTVESIDSFYVPKVLMK